MFSPPDSWDPLATSSHARKCVLITGEKMIRSKIFENDLPCTCENYEKTLMNLCDAWDIPTPILLKNNFYHFETFHITRYPAKNFVEKSVDCGLVRNIVGRHRFFNSNLCNCAYIFIQR